MCSRMCPAMILDRHFCLFVRLFVVSLISSRRVSCICKCITAIDAAGPTAASRHGKRGKGGGATFSRMLPCISRRVPSRSVWARTSAFRTDRGDRAAAPAAPDGSPNGSPGSPRRRDERAEPRATRSAMCWSRPEA